MCEEIAVVENLSEEKIVKKTGQCCICIINAYVTCGLKINATIALYTHTP